VFRNGHITTSTNCVQSSQHTSNSAFTLCQEMRLRQPMVLTQDGIFKILELLLLYILKNFKK